MSKIGVTAIIKKQDDDSQIEKFLIITSKKDTGKHSGKLYPPSGWVEEGESDELALVRELKEELSIDIKPIQLITKLEGDLPDLVLHFWNCEIINDNDFKLDESELKNYQWLTISEIISENTYPTTIEFFKEYI